MKINVLRNINSIVGVWFIKPACESSGPGLINQAPTIQSRNWENDFHSPPGEARIMRGYHENKPTDYTARPMAATKKIGTTDYADYTD